MAELHGPALSHTDTVVRKSGAMNRRRGGRLGTGPAELITSYCWSLGLDFDLDETPKG